MSEKRAAQPRSDAKRRTGRPKGTGSQRVYEALRERILTLELVPGSDLNEAALEAEFEVSRTPVREALIRLASERLISLSPNRGASVTPLDIADVPQLFEALELSQRATLRWAAKRRSPADIEGLAELSAEFTKAAREQDFRRMGDANREFHVAVGRASGNRYIAELYETQLWASLRLARMVFANAPLSDPSHSRYYAEVIRHHEGMIAAIEAGDEDRADELARKHAELFKRRVTQSLQAGSAGDIALDR